LGPRVEAGIDAHYVDARYYDHVYKRRREDARFYADLAEKSGGPVLELGVGTGRVALEIAQRGIDVLGVDRMPEMLARGKERLDRAPKTVRSRVALVRGDMTRLSLDRRFPLVIAPFNVFMHLYERADWERALAVAAAHLEKRGRLVFDVLMPMAHELARNPHKTYRCRPVTRPEDDKTYTYGESFEYDPVTQIQLITMVFSRDDEPESYFITPLAHRQIFPAELEALLHYNGFRIVERHGDFKGGPLTSESDSQVVIAARR
jgi:SAM-dependent methyltransferase